MSALPVSPARPPAPTRPARPATPRRTTPGSARPAPRPHTAGLGEPARNVGPKLQAVAAPMPSRSRPAFLLLCVSILIGAMMAVLLLNTAAAQGSYEEHDLKSELTRAEAAAQDATERLEAVSAPASLQAKAKKLGMVRIPVSGYIDLDEGTILDTTDGKN